jgi:DNA invertase Pin-like site-specific DNA recombinase
MTATKAYSHIRFSSSEQRKGDSLRRQLAASEAYAEAHGLELDTSMRDLGLSGWTGDNRTKGALGAFLKRVEAGTIPAGSVLIVEALDRLTREGILDAQLMFLSIIKAGIRVVTLMDNQVYDRDNLNIGQLVLSLVILSQGTEYSRKLSERLKDVSANKRKQTAEGHKVPNRCPAWLRWPRGPDGRPAPNGEYEVIEERAAAIRLIFELKASGMGKEAIARKLNSMPVWQPQEHKANPGGWRPSYIEKLLHSRAVIGEYQPHKMVGKKRVPVGDAIPDYFPPIVDLSLFNRVQSVLARNASIPGRGGGANGSIANVFGHIARCARCGGTMAHMDPVKDLLTPPG